MLICNKVLSFVHLRNGCSTNFPVLQPEEFNARYLTDMESCPDGKRKTKQKQKKHAVSCLHASEYSLTIKNEKFAQIGIKSILFDT